MKNNNKKYYIMGLVYPKFNYTWTHLNKFKELLKISECKNLVVYPVDFKTLDFFSNNKYEMFGFDTKGSKNAKSRSIPIIVEVNEDGWLVDYVLREEQLNELLDEYIAPNLDTDNIIKNGSLRYKSIFGTKNVRVNKKKN